MKRHLANVLTLSRLVMAIAIFCLLGFYRADRPAEGALLVNVALVLLGVALATDVLDGYVARRWGSPTAFGRISDPFIDKVLVCGAFTYFVGGNFLTHTSTGELVTATGMHAWMAVVVVAREVFVTGVRGFSETRGEAFNTTVAGKAKMFFQSATIVTVLIVLGPGRSWGPWVTTTRDLLIWFTVIFSAFSALVYVPRIRRLMAAPEASGTQSEAAE